LSPSDRGGGNAQPHPDAHGPPHGLPLLHHTGRPDPLAQPHQPQSGRERRRSTTRRTEARGSTESVTRRVSKARPARHAVNTL
jgi:hypothetical protein